MYWFTRQFLRKKGHLPEEPTGYFGEATETAVKKWQSADAIAASRGGVMDMSSRTWYACAQAEHPNINGSFLLAPRVCVQDCCPRVV